MDYGAAGSEYGDRPPCRGKAPWTLLMGQVRDFGTVRIFAKSFFTETFMNSYLVGLLDLYLAKALIEVSSYCLRAGKFHWRSLHYAVVHVHNKIVTFKGGNLMWQR